MRVTHSLNLLMLLGLFHYTIFGCFNCFLPFDVGIPTCIIGDSCILCFYYGLMTRIKAKYNIRIGGFEVKIIFILEAT